MKKQDIKIKFAKYPSINYFFRDIKSTDTKRLFNRLQDSNINLNTCNSLIKEISERKRIAPYQSFASVVPTITLAVFYVLSINQNNGFMDAVYLILLGGLAYWLLYRVLPSHDNSITYLSTLFNDERFRFVVRI